MNLEHYKLELSDELLIFEFVSVGPNGNIQKIVHFQNTEIPGLYNLAFGDKNIETGELDDLSVSNNGDMQKVLATVIAALFIFFDSFPDAFVVASGSTPARTRLYQMGVSRYFLQMQEYFEVLGETDYAWEPFTLGSQYISFLVTRKFK